MRYCTESDSKMIGKFDCSHLAGVSVEADVFQPQHLCAVWDDAPACSRGKLLVFTLAKSLCSLMRGKAQGTGTCIRSQKLRQRFALSLRDSARRRPAALGAADSWLISQLTRKQREVSRCLR